jgi:hypothetical protein
MRERDRKGFREPAERNRDERGPVRESVSGQLIGERERRERVGEREGFFVATWCSPLCIRGLE